MPKPNAKTRQYTLDFKVQDDAQDAALIKWIDDVVNKTGVKPMVLLKAAIHWGRADAQKRAEERYARLKAIDGYMFADRKAAPAPAPQGQQPTA